MKKKILKVFLILSLLFVLGVALVLGSAWWYISKQYPAEKLGKIASEFLASTFHAETKIGGIYLSFPLKVVVKDVDMQPRKDPENRFKVGEISVGISLFSLLNKQIAFSGVYVNQPDIRLHIDKQGEMQLGMIPFVRPVIAMGAVENPVKSGFSIDPGRIYINGGKVTFFDESGKLPKGTQLDGINGWVHPNLNDKVVEYQITINNTGICGKAESEGLASWATRTVKSHFYLEKLNTTHFAIKDMPVELIPALSDIDAAVEINEELFKLSLKKIKAGSSSLNGTLQFPLKKTGEVVMNLESGDFDLALFEKLIHHFAQKQVTKDQIPTMQGILRLKIDLTSTPAFIEPKFTSEFAMDSVILTFPKMGKISLAGKMTANQKEVLFSNFSVAGTGVSGTLGGKVQLKETRALDISIKNLELDFSKLTDQLKKLNTQAPISGKLRGSAVISGTVAKPSATGSVSAESIKIPLDKSSMTVNGQVELKDKMINFKDVSLDSQLGKAMLSGRVDQIFTNPQPNLKGEVSKVQLAEVVKFMAVKDITAVGELNLGLELGMDKDKVKGTFSGKGTGVDLTILSADEKKKVLQIPFNGIDLTGTIVNETVTSSVSSNLFSGKLGFDLGVKYREKTLPYTLKITSDSLDLQSFLKVNPYARKALRGLFNLNANFSGSLVKMNSWVGKGNITFKDLLLDGKILFGKLAPHIPNLADERFDKSQVDLRLEKMNFYLENLLLDNTDMKWTGGAVADLKTMKLSGKTVLYLKKAAVKKGSDLEKLIPADSGFPVDVIIGGTLFDPQFNVNFDLAGLVKKSLTEDVKAKVIDQLQDKEKRKDVEDKVKKGLQKGLKNLFR